MWNWKNMSAQILQIKDKLRKLLVLFDISKQLQEWKKVKYTPWLMIHHRRGYSTKISLPIHIVHLIKSQPFHTPEAWKRYPFWATPPSIGLYREYPSSFIIGITFHMKPLWQIFCISSTNNLVLWILQKRIFLM